MNESGLIGVQIVDPGDGILPLEITGLNLVKKIRSAFLRGLFSELLTICLRFGQRRHRRPRMDTTIDHYQYTKSRENRFPHG
jgi:hypothetical protein